MGIHFVEKRERLFHGVRVVREARTENELSVATRRDEWPRSFAHEGPGRVHLFENIRIRSSSRASRIVRSIAHPASACSTKIERTGTPRLDRIILALSIERTTLIFQWVPRSEEKTSLNESIPGRASTSPVHVVQRTWENRNRDCQAEQTVEQENRKKSISRSRSPSPTSKSNFRNNNNNNNSNKKSNEIATSTPARPPKSKGQRYIKK